MYLRDSIYVLARRWYVVVPVFLLLAICVNVLAQATPYSYETKATVVLLSPSIATRNDPTLANPYLGFSGNLQSTAMILTAAATDNDAVTALASQGATANYTVGPDPTTPDAPVLLVDAKDTDAAVSARTRDAIVTFLRADLDRRQRAARSPANIFITLSVVSASPPKRLDTAKKKVLAGGAAVAFVLPVLIAFGVEGWAFRRGRRRERAEPGRVPLPRPATPARRSRGRAPAKPGTEFDPPFPVDPPWPVDPPFPVDRPRPVEPPGRPDPPRRARTPEALAVRPGPRPGLADRPELGPGDRHFAESPTVQAGLPRPPRSGPHGGSGPARDR